MGMKPQLVYFIFIQLVTAECLTENMSEDILDAEAKFIESLKALRDIPNTSGSSTSNLNADDADGAQSSPVKGECDPESDGAVADDAPPSQVKPQGDPESDGAVADDAPPSQVKPQGDRESDGAAFTTASIWLTFMLLRASLS
ncbi:hypothetical protein CSKR_100150, partial [Clonorchis sinensis]